jgi:hypothetical protein
MVDRGDGTKHASPQTLQNTCKNKLYKKYICKSVAYKCILMFWEQGVVGSNPVIPTNGIAM